MQVDQFESEVESLSVQTRKKKGDKEVSVLSSLIHFLCSARLSVCSPPPASLSPFVSATGRSVAQPAGRLAALLSPLLSPSLLSVGEVTSSVLYLSSASALTRITLMTTSFTFSLTHLSFKVLSWGLI